jgi:hypothetical protein
MEDPTTVGMIEEVVLVGPLTLEGLSGPLNTMAPS